MNKQRSVGWFNERKNRITGSVAGALLGVSPLMTRKQAIQRLIDPDSAQVDEFTENTIFEYGRMMEEHALELFKLDSGLDVKECGFYPYSNWLGASPDGIVINEENEKIGVLEIKVPWSLRNEEDDKFKSIGDLPHYYAQVQIEMHCTGLNTAYFYQYANGKSKLEVVDYDVNWIKVNIHNLREIWNIYYGGKVDKNQMYVDRYFELVDLINKLNKEKTELMTHFKDELHNEPGQIGKAFLKMHERKGSVDYKKALNEENITIDEERYRRKASQVWSLEKC